MSLWGSPSLPFPAPAASSARGPALAAWHTITARDSPENEDSVLGQCCKLPVQHPGRLEGGDGPAEIEVAADIRD